MLGSLDTANERETALFTDVLERFVAAITDHNAGERGGNRAAIAKAAD